MNIQSNRSFTPKASSLAAKYISILVVLVFCAVLGFVSATFPSGFVIKAASPLVLLLVFLYALLAKDSFNPAEGGLLFLIACWLILHTCVPTYLSAKFGSLPDLSPYRIVGWAIVVSLVYLYFVSKIFRLILRQRLKDASPLFGLLISLIIWQVVAAIAGDSPLFSLGVFFKGWFFSLLLFLLAMVAIRDLRDVNRLLVILVCAAVFSTFLGGVEWLHRGNLFASFFPSDPENMEGLKWILWDSSRDGAYRVSSVFSHPLVFGEYVAMTLPICLYLAIYASHRGVRFISRFALLALPIGIYLSHTRSSMMASFIGVIAFFVVRSLVRSRNTRSKIASLIIAGIIVTIIFVLTASFAKGLVEGRSQAERGSTEARTQMINKGLVAIGESPLLGYGLATGAAKIGYLNNSSSLTIDNYYLSMAIENGIPGLLLYIILLFFPFLYIFKPLSENNSGLLAALLASLLVYIVIRAVLSLTHNQDLFVLIVAAIARVVCLGEGQPNDVVEKDKRPGRALLISPKVT